MSKPAPEGNVMPRWMRAWEEFWFRAADPQLLGLVRILCGSIVVYTLAVYSFSLQDFMGENAWYDLETRMETVNERPNVHGPLNWSDSGRLPAPENDFQLAYLGHYREKWGFQPPPPYPKDWDEANALDEFRLKYGSDLRINGLRPWANENEKDYAEKYTAMWGSPPPAYPKNDEEARAIQDYMTRWRADPRRLHSQGMPLFSLWFHVTDPTAMAAIHTLIVLVSVLFTLGFCTRVTAAMLWFGSLTYIHRNQLVLFGVDTMMTIMLLYLMIGPSGAAFSVDRLIARWWRDAKPRYVAAWYRFWRRPVPDMIAPAAYDETPQPSVSANVAIRLLQVHVCIIYLMAGLSKLLGQSWWSGSAIWFTVANYEFSPMHSEIYLGFLRLLGSHQLLYDAFMTGGGLFTLAFEIGYAFLIWRPRMRWVFLGAAILLHGGIGFFMGLKTFSLMMLVMNMAFLRKEEALWIASWFGFLVGTRDTVGQSEATAPPHVPAPAAATSTAITKK